MPLDRGIIDQQLEALGEGTRWWNVRELRDLPAALSEDEHILAISRGKIGRPRWLHHTWLIVLTEKRLLCLRSGWRQYWRQFEVPTAAVVRVTLRIGPFRGRVVVVTNGRTYRLLLPRTDAYRFQATLAGMVQPGKAQVSGFGPARMARQVIDHVLALPAVALAPAGGTERAAPPAPSTDTRALEQHVQLLEDQLHLLQQQVDFLEQLLQHSAQRAGDAAPERSRQEAARPDEQALAQRAGDAAPERSRQEAARPDEQALAQARQLGGDTAGTVRQLAATPSAEDRDPA